MGRRSPRAVVYLCSTRRHLSSAAEIEVDTHRVVRDAPLQTIRAKKPAVPTTK